MGIIEYNQSKSLSADGSFQGLIMAAMRNADNNNLEKLKAAFPDTWQELNDRYHAPGGALSDTERRYVLDVWEKQNG